MKYSPLQDIHLAVGVYLELVFLGNSQTYILPQFGGEKEAEVTISCVDSCKTNHNHGIVDH